MIRFLVLFFFAHVTFLSNSQTTLRIKAEPGGYFLLNNKEVNLTVVGNGSKSLPYVIDGKGITLTGNSFIRITNQSSHIIIKNIKFINNNIFYRNSTSLIEIGQNKRSTVDNIIIDNIEFIFNYPNFLDRDKETQFHWINISGNNVVIQNCTFSGKKNRLPIIHINSGFKNVVVKNNIFKNVPSRKGEALEAIRIGLEDGESNARITNNLFNHYSGDSETISVKASGVQIDENNFTNCRSGISLRYADNCVIKSNKFKNVSNAIRIAGKNHIIENNTFDLLDSQNSIICMLGGPNYPRVNNIVINSNFFKKPPKLVLLEVKNNSLMPTNIYLKNNVTPLRKTNNISIKEAEKIIYRKTVRKDGARLYYLDF